MGLLAAIAAGLLGEGKLVYVAVGFVLVMVAVGVVVGIYLAPGVQPWSCTKYPVC
jgi:hypothetical protein